MTCAIIIIHFSEKKMSPKKRRLELNIDAVRLAKHCFSCRLAG